MKNINIIEILNSKVSNKTNTLNYYISKALLDNLSNINKININQLAKLAFCSKASIVRFCKSLELDGYKDLIASLSLQFKIFSNSQVNDSFDIDSTTKMKMYQTFIIENINYIFDHNFINIKNAAYLIHNTDKIFLFGKGANLYNCNLLYGSLIKLGYNALTSYDIDIQEKLLKNASPNSVALFFSYSGLTEQIIKIYNEAKAKKLKIIVISSNVKSPIYEENNINIISLNNEEIIYKQRSCVISYSYIVMQIINLLVNTKN